MLCNNYSECHKPEVLSEDNCAIWVYCPNCGQSERIGKDKKGSPEHRLYSQWYQRDILQRGEPLYYKYQGAKRMNVV